MSGSAGSPGIWWRSSSQSPRSIIRQRFEQKGRYGERSALQGTCAPHWGQVTIGVVSDDTALKGERDIIADLLGSFALLGLFHETDVAEMPATADFGITLAGPR